MYENELKLMNSRDSEGFLFTQPENCPKKSSMRIKERSSQYIDMEDESAECGSQTHKSPNVKERNHDYMAQIYLKGKTSIDALGNQQETDLKRDP
jgi:hypothetical protein